MRTCVWVMIGLSVGCASKAPPHVREAPPEGVQARASADAGSVDATPDAPIAAVLPDGAMPAEQPPPSVPVPTQVARVPFRMTDMNADGEKRCAKALPRCKHVYAEVDAPPHPCANQGTLCTKQVPPPTGWLCQCAECTGDSDCGAGHHCEIETTVCPTHFHAGTCQPGPQPPPTMCPAPA